MNWKRTALHPKHNKAASSVIKLQSSMRKDQTTTSPTSLRGELQDCYDATLRPGEAPAISDSVAFSEELARNSLPEFYQRGIGASTWAVFQSADLMRIAYVGTEGSNLSHLINLEGQPYTNGSETLSVAPLHLPHPAIRPTRPWKPEADQNMSTLFSRDYLRDLSSFPAKDVRDSLVDSYFERINPYFPVVDESQFRRQYVDNTNPPGLLLFQSVLLAGAHVSDHPKVVQARPTVRNALFRRAKALFEMRHENDRLHLVQSALLFTWHLENADTASCNSHYWAGVACRIAFGIGMHRDLTDSGPRVILMPLNDRRIYRRVWWTIFQVEILTALEYGRPSMIDPDEIDQPPLDIDDFTEENGLVNDRLRLDYSQRNIDLCRMILQVLKVNSPGIRTKAEVVQSIMKSLDYSLASWMRLPLESNDFASLQLHIHYHSILLHLHRNNSKDSSATQCSPANVSVEICNQSANAIITILETIISNDMISQCYFTCVTAVTAAAIYFSRMVGNALDQGSKLLANIGHSQLERLLQLSKQLGKYWANGEAVYKLFQSLSQRFRARILELLDKSTEGQITTEIGAHISDPQDVTVEGSSNAQGQLWTIISSEQPNNVLQDIDIQDLFLYPLVQQPLNGTEDWMNVSPG